MADDDYQVGYKKPPKHSRFQKGRSGNPKGRPKGRQSVATLLDAMLHETITVREGDRVRRMTMLQALLYRLLQGSLKGEARAFKNLFDLLREHGIGAPPAPEQQRYGVLRVSEPMSEEEWEKKSRRHYEEMEAIMRRIANGDDLRGVVSPPDDEE